LIINNKGLIPYESIVGSQNDVTMMLFDDETIIFGTMSPIKSSIMIYKKNHALKEFCLSQNHNNIHDGTVCCLKKFNEKVFISSDNDGNLLFWSRDDANGQFKPSENFIKEHTCGVTSMLHGPENTFITGSYDHTIKVWKITSEVQISEPKTLSGHEKSVNDLLMIDEKTLFSLSDDFIKIWKWNEELKNFDEFKSVPLEFGIHKKI